MKKYNLFLLFFFLPSLLFASDYQISRLSSRDMYVQKSAPMKTFEYEGNLLVSNQVHDEYISLIRFDISTLPTLSPDGRAYVLLYNNTRKPNQLVESLTSSEISVSLLDTNMNPKATWKNSFALYKKADTLAKSVKVEYGGYWTSIEITDYYNYWKANTTRNKGFMLRSQSGSELYSFSSTKNRNVDERPILRLKDESKSAGTIFLVPSVSRPSSANMCRG